MSIEVNHLLKLYGNQKAVENISFKINKGEIVGFMGPNGAGKSTTLKIITGYLKQDGGDAFVCNMNVSEHPREIKKNIGYLPESNALYFDMYIREYLGFIAELHQMNGKTKTRIEEIIELTGLTLESKKKIGQLSKGYKQRVGLAAALIHDPEVLILDEPTSGLDPNQIIEIRDVIKQQGENKTVLFSSHILQEVEALCDRVIIINKGQLVADDTLNNLQKGMQEKEVLIIQFKEPIELSLFNTLKGIESVEQISATGIKLVSKNTEQVREQVFELALQNNLNIVSLQSENQSLEEVFKLLTK